MFSYIKGKLEGKAIGYVVVDVQGIGFKIFMSEPAIERLGEVGQEVKIHTHFQVREDDMSLYGFLSNDELRMFELLLSVSGIGAKSAITMLSHINPSQFALAVISNDVKGLTKVQGIGPKTAQRIILELKDKLKTEESIQKTEDSQIQNAVVQDSKVEETISALKVLGYGRQEIEQVLDKIDIKDKTVEDMIRQSLSYLGR